MQDHTTAQYDSMIRDIAQQVYRAELQAHRHTANFQNDDSRTAIFDTDLYELWARAYLHGLLQLDEFFFSAPDGLHVTPTTDETLFMSSYAAISCVRHAHHLIGAPPVVPVIGRVSITVRDGDDVNSEQGYGARYGGNPHVWHTNLQHRIKGITEVEVAPPHVWGEFPNVFAIANPTADEVTVNDYEHPIAQQFTRPMQLSNSLNIIAGQCKTNDIDIGIEPHKARIYEVNPIAIKHYSKTVSMQYDGFTGISQHINTIIGNDSLASCVADFIGNEFVYWAEGCKYGDDIDADKVAREVRDIKRVYA